MKVIWTGVNEFKSYMRTTPDMVERAIDAALTQEGENMMGVSKRRTPVDTGDLRATGHVKPPRDEQRQRMVELAYGTDYAVYVHEITTNQHKVGQAKFLESAVKGRAKNLSMRLSERIAKALGAK